VKSGAAVGSQSTIAAIRHAREREGSGGRLEETSANPSNFSNPPARGDWVTALGAPYAVTTLRQPDAYGMIAVTLLKRMRSTRKRYLASG
jgi:hypothetical protein